MTDMESRACVREAEEEPGWRTFSPTSSAEDCLGSWAVRAVGTETGDGGGERTWCIRSSESSMEVAAKATVAS